MRHPGNNTAGRSDPRGTLSTFGGVFTPSILTILGLVLFLRLGYVVGNVGLGATLLILAGATAVSVLTTVSLAAIATNLKVRGGGVYFLISRTLGPAFGGAIGLVLYGAMSVSVAFYAIGLGEAVASIVGADPGQWARPIAALTVLALIGLGWLGADIATRLQYVVMVLLALALVSFFLGVTPDLDVGLAADNVRRQPGGEGFWFTFAIFFPAVTGFTQGVAMSGDLRDPSRSITRGTFAAVGVSTVVYLAVVLALAARFSTAELRADPDVMRKASLWSPLIDAGVVAATLSSAIASLLGAPRVLQRLAADKLIRRLEWFAAGAGTSSNPRRATVLTGGLALVTVAAGDLNAVAPIISMFFLVSYGLINYATYYEARAASASFRPRFRFFDARLSLLGTFACGAAIIAIDPLAGAVAAGLLAAIFAGLRRGRRAARWTDSTRAHHLTEARRHLLAAADAVDDGRDWRPCALAFVPRDPDRRDRLLTMASWLSGGIGFTTAVRLVVGTGPVVRRQAEVIEADLRRETRETHPDVFARAVTAPHLGDAAAAVIQGHGLGDIEVNLTLHGWTDLHRHLADPDDEHTDALLQATRLGANVVIAHAPAGEWDRLTPRPGEIRRIAVLWADDRSGQIMTLLAWLMTRHLDWTGASITVHVPGGPERLEAVATLLDDARIEATLASVDDDPAALFPALGTADLAMVPLRIRHGHPLGPGDVEVDEVLSYLRLAMLVRPAEDVELVSEPDEGTVALLAEALDRAAQTEARARELDDAAGRLVVEVEALRLQLGPHAPDADLARLHDLEQELAAVQRRYADALTRAREASSHAERLAGAGSARPDPDIWVPRPPG